MACNGWLVKLVLKSILGYEASAMNYKPLISNCNLAMWYGTGEGPYIQVKANIVAIMKNITASHEKLA